MADAVPIPNDDLASSPGTKITVTKDTLQHPAFWVLVGLGLGALYTYMILHKKRA